MNRQQRIYRAICLLFAWCTSMITYAQSDIIDSISGFDAKRIEASFPITDPSTLGESAKLLYRLARVESGDWSSEPGYAPERLEIGQTAQLLGSVQLVQRYKLPEVLEDVLGFEHIHVIELADVSGIGLSTNSSPDNRLDRPIEVLVAKVPNQISADDRVSFQGIVVETQTSVAFATNQLSWFPEKSNNPDWAWLAENDIDIAAVASLADRDRQPLSAEDSALFYSMLAVTAAPSSGSEGFPNAAAIQPVELLKESASLAGRYFNLPVEIAQITKVAVGDTERREQLGSNHYFQIDAFGDLGNVVVRIEPETSKADSSPSTQTQDSAAVFENRYPVSIVTRDLPSFLKDVLIENAGPSAVAATVSVPVTVDGFLFRSWSYQSEYMQQFGDAKQYSPLLIVASFADERMEGTDPIGVGLIGWIAAAATAIAIVSIWIWSRVTLSGDRSARKRRRSEREVVPLIELD